MGGGLGRDKESPLPSLNPINAKTSAPPSKLPDMPPPKAQVAPPAQRSILGTTAQAGADEAFDFSDEDEFESSAEEGKRAPNIDFNTFNYKK